MSRQPDRDPEELAALLSDLRETLDELDRTVDGGEDAGRRRPRAPDPPRGRDVVRFTEEYTIPTAISVLETTIRSLELLRGLLRLVDPERRFADDRGDGSRLAGVDDRVVDGAERAVDDLRRVLSGTEEPSDPAAREVLGDARALTAEIESLLDDARNDAARRPRADSRDDRGTVVIPVDDEDESDDGAAETDADDADVAIDVDAELESIRDEVYAESSTREDSAGTDDEERDSKRADGRDGSENEG